MKTFTLTIDGRRYDVDAEGKNLLHVCLSLGMNLPYFCWHPALGSVGACRQCAVKLYKDEADTRGRIVMSCMTPVTDGMRLSIEDPDARMDQGFFRGPDRLHRCGHDLRIRHCFRSRNRFVEKIRAIHLRIGHVLRQFQHHRPWSADSKICKSPP